MDLLVMKVLFVIITSLASFMHRYVFLPSQNPAFVKTCLTMNNKELTYENLQELHSPILIQENKNTLSYDQRFTSLRQIYLDQYLHGPVNPSGPFSQPYIYIWPNAIEDKRNDLHIAAHSFDMSQSDNLHDWRCNISLDPKTHKIKAQLYYYPWP